MGVNRNERLRPMYGFLLRSSQVRRGLLVAALQQLTNWLGTDFKYDECKSNWEGKNNLLNQCNVLTSKGDSFDKLRKMADKTVGKHGPYASNRGQFASY